MLGIVNNYTFIDRLGVKSGSFLFYIFAKITCCIMRRTQDKEASITHDEGYTIHLKVYYAID